MLLSSSCGASFSSNEFRELWRAEAIYEVGRCENAVRKVKVKPLALNGDKRLPTGNWEPFTHLLPSRLIRP